MLRFKVVQPPKAGEVLQLKANQILEKDRDKIQVEKHRHGEEAPAFAPPASLVLTMRLSP